VNYSAE